MPGRFRAGPSSREDGRERPPLFGGGRAPARSGDWARRGISRNVLLAFLLAAAAGGPGGAQSEVPLGAPTPLSKRQWLAAPADGVDLRLSWEGDALRLDFDFHDHGGWAAARLPLGLELPANWALSFDVRGEAPANSLEVKFVDPTGENVWWSVRRDYAWPREWTTLRVKKRQARFAWGPARGGEIARLGALELAITAGTGGRGTVWLRNFRLDALPADAPYAGTPRASATGAAPGHPPTAALDGDRATFWQGPAGGASWTVDFGARRELGGLTLHWLAGGAPPAFRVELSDDGAVYRPGGSISNAGGDRSDLALSDEETRFVRVTVPAGDRSIALAELVVRPLAFGETMNALVEEVGREAPRGDYPRAFSGEQVYWTVVGLDGGESEVLVSEDGASEIAPGGPSLEPFLEVDGVLHTWADTAIGQSLDDGDLPTPSVTWRTGDVRLTTTALAIAVEGGSRLALRYRLENLGAAERRGALYLTARPFQVNPPTQFLGIAGGLARLERAACASDGLQLDERRVVLTPLPSRCGTSVFDQGSVVAMLRKGSVPAASDSRDERGLASAVAGWSFALAPGAAQEVIATTALDGAPPPATIDAAGFAAEETRARREWRARLDRVELLLPESARELGRTLRTGLAAILIHRDGPSIQPGSRAYARSWIRDGALTGAALLRLGHLAAAREFADWYSGYLYADGKVPCCVDRRGADPVPENDSHGEWIHLVREVYRYGRDLEFARRHFPSIERAVAYLDRLRGERRGEAYASGEARVFFGLLPQSISHEGYSEKPMHSYWDDAFGYLGYDDAAELAEALGRPELAARWRRSRDEFGGDLAASIAAVERRDGIDYLPGCAELGDFDATSSTILLEPTALADRLPRAAVEATFARFAREFEERRDGRRPWDVYTPYELRAVGAYVRLGWRDGAHELLDYYLAGRRPAAWNQWAEVVEREPRTPRFLGDLPHGWVASDYARSLLDLFAYERRGARQLVLAAGIPRRWLEGGETIGVRGLETPWGPLSYRLSYRGERLQADIEALAETPPGGIVLALPLAASAGQATLDGASIPASAEIRLARLPARLVVERPW